MQIQQRTVVVILVLSALGYLGAGLFYGYLVGLDTQTSLTCPVCPHITSSGTPSQKFLVRTIVLGTLNALFFLCLAWIPLGLISVARKVARGLNQKR